MCLVRKFELVKGGFMCIRIHINILPTYTTNDLKQIEKKGEEFGIHCAYC